MENVPGREAPKREHYLLRESVGRKQMQQQTGLE